LILQDILYKVSIRSVKGNTHVEINGLHIDSRNVKPSSCFIALKGTQTNGDEFIASAVENGATAIICEVWPSQINEAVTYVQVDSAAEAAGYMSHNFYGEPSLKLKLVGVTGTNGKTTIATLLWKLFTALGYKCGLIGTVQNQVGEKIITATHTTPDAVNINALLKQMADEGIIINTAGIGSPQGSTIIDELTGQEKKDMNGNTVITRLNEEELKTIAEKGNGMYQLYTGTDALVNRLDAQLAGMDQRTITENSLVNYRYFFPYFLMLVLFLMVIELLISERKSVGNQQLAAHSILRIGKSALKKSVVFTVALCLLSLHSNAQNDNTLIKKGNEAYEKKAYDIAIKNYQQASEKMPADPVASFNLGNALYKNNKAEEAVQAYDEALAKTSSKADRSRSFYNKGVVLQHNKKLPECIEAYKQALKLDPQDEDARLNLQKALQQQKEQQQKEDKSKKEKNKPEDNKRQEEKEKPKEQDKPDQPKPQASKLSRQDAEEKLKALLQQEKSLQDKLRKVNTATSARPEKDW